MCLEKLNCKLLVSFIFIKVSKHFVLYVLINFNINFCFPLYKVLVTFVFTKPYRFFFYVSYLCIHISFWLKYFLYHFLGFIFILSATFLFYVTITKNQKIYLPNSVLYITKSYTFDISILIISNPLSLLAEGTTNTW